MNSSVQLVCGQHAARALPRKDEVYELGRSQYLRLRNGKGTTVRVVTGTLWVTQDGDARDVILEPGDDFVIDCTALSVLAPLGEMQVRLVLGDARRAARKALAWLPLGRPGYAWNR